VRLVAVRVMVRVMVRAMVRVARLEEAPVMVRVAVRRSVGRRRVEDEEETRVPAARSPQPRCYCLGPFFVVMTITPFAPSTP
jgi:hypothetical protein